MTLVIYGFSFIFIDFCNIKLKLLFSSIPLRFFLLFLFFLLRRNNIIRLCVIYKLNIRGWNRTIIYSNCILCKTIKQKKEKITRKKKIQVVWLCIVMRQEQCFLSLCCNFMKEGVGGSISNFCSIIFHDLDSRAVSALMNEIVLCSYSPNTSYSLSWKSLHE